MLANPEADVEFDGKAIHVRGILVKDRATIEAVSRAYLEKYRDGRIRLAIRLWRLVEQFESEPDLHDGD
jgi:hypothetical protein